MIYVLGAEAKYQIILKTFFSLISPLFEKKCDKSKFSWLALSFKCFLIKIQPNMSEQKRNNKKSMICFMPKPSPKNFLNTSLWSPSNPDVNSLDYAIWGIFENKTNATSNPNIGSLKTAIEEEWNKMPEEFILKTCKLFWRHVDTMIEKNGGHME